MKKKDLKTLKKMFDGVYSEIARLDGEVFGLKKDLNRKVFINEEEVLSKNDKLLSALKLEDDIKIDKSGLEPGKWYRSKIVNCLSCYSGILTGYGVLKNLWTSSLSMTHASNWVLATHKEVEAALIEEAKRRGYSANSYKYNPHHNELYFGDKLSFINGIWATIAEEPKQEIDWSKPGQLVICDDKYEGKEHTTILITTSHHVDKSNFEGIVLKSTFYKINEIHLFSKDMFRLYNDPITLKND